MIPWLEAAALAGNLINANAQKQAADKAARRFMALGNQAFNTLNPVAQPLVNIGTDAANAQKSITGLMMGRVGQRSNLIDAQTRQNAEDISRDAARAKAEAGMAYRFNPSRARGSMLAIADKTRRALNTNSLAGVAGQEDYANRNLGLAQGAVGAQFGMGQTGMSLLENAARLRMGQGNMANQTSLGGAQQFGEDIGALMGDIAGGSYSKLLTGQDSTQDLIRKYWKKKIDSMPG